MDLTIEQWAIGRLIPYARNARTHSDTQVAQIAGSITAFGFNNPILVDPEGGIIAGHGRVLAARQLRRSVVPVIVLGHLNENQKRAFMLADNKLGDNAGWDEQMLRLELEALAKEDFELALTGFDESELKKLAAKLDSSLQVDADEAPELKPEVVARRGELWQLGDHRLLCADATENANIARVLDHRSCELIIADLPYNVDYTGKTSARMKLENDDLGEGFGDFLERACRAMLSCSEGAVYLWMSSAELHRLQAAFQAAGGHFSTYIIWAKNQFTLGRADYQRQFEPMLYGWRKGCRRYWCGDRDQGDVWCFDKPRANDLHPTMKPVGLIERVISNSSRPGDVVLDPFAGSGSTLIACENTGRQGRAIEIDERYVDVMIRRWQNYTGRVARRCADGCSFAEVADGQLSVEA